MYAIGVDIGGTFTDIAVLDGEGILKTYKTSSTPAELGRGVKDGLGLAASDLGLSLGELLGDTIYFGHGTTAATNALIERKGSRTALITTRGFGDTLLIQRMLGMTAGLHEEQTSHYSLRAYPDPIVPPELIFEVTERVDYKGAEIVRLRDDDVGRAIVAIRDAGVDAVAVCLLWSFLNSAHERRIREIFEELAPEIQVSLSSDVIPVIREYERTATTVINAYLRAIIGTYVGGLQRDLRERGLASPFLIVNSIGGVVTADEAASRAVTLLTSGPTGGVNGSVSLGKILGHPNVITTDMGGTSFDVGLIIDGRPLLSTITPVEKYHILTPMISIETIGAGGGSIARVADGHLMVGPDSAGARPGPACYDRGGELPTVTDADVVLGILNPDNFLGGRIRLNRRRAEDVIAQHIAQPLSIGIQDAAAGIRRVVDGRMADLLRRLTLEKGQDPRDFVLYAYGGAGPAHCTGYGAELHVQKILVPVTATVHSAFGAVASDLHYTFEISDLMHTPADFDTASEHLAQARINDTFGRLEDQGRQALAANDIPPDRMAFHRSADFRFRRQTNEVLIPAPDGELDASAVDAWVADFEARYEQLYGPGSAFREAGVEITTFRVEAVGLMTPFRLMEYQPRDGDAGEARMEDREVYFPELGKRVPTPIYDGGALTAGAGIAGPAVVEYPGTTVAIGPAQSAAVDEFLNLTIELE